MFAAWRVKGKPMTNPTQSALDALEVTQADRDAACVTWHRLQTEGRNKTELLSEAFARHRIAAIAAAEARGKAKATSAILAYLRNQEGKGAKIANASPEGSTRRAAYGGGAYALHLAAESIETSDPDEWLTMCIGCDMPIGHKEYMADDNGETGCPACFTDDGSGACWNAAILAKLEGGQ
jgi:hypothetical protein